MPMNRVQFQPGLSMPEFIKLYGTEAQCEAALVQCPGPQDLAAQPVVMAAIVCFPAGRA